MSVSFEVIVEVKSGDKYYVNRILHQNISYNRFNELIKHGLDSLGERLKIDGIDLNSAITFSITVKQSHL